MEKIVSSLLIEGISFNLTFSDGNFFFDDKFKEFSSNQFKTDIFNNEEIVKMFSFNYDFITKSYNKKNIAFELQEQIIESQKLPNKKGFIYLITDGVFTKIGGTSYDVKKRLLELQTGNAKKLNILGYYKCEYLNITEKLIHNEYKDKNELNEWFRLDIKDYESILKNKFTFTISEDIKTLSHISVINIICEQIRILRDYSDYKYKKYKRLTNKYKIDKILLKIISSEQIKKFKDTTVKKYLSKRYTYDNFEQIINNHKKLVKENDELLNINSWIQMLNKDLYDYINLNNIEYNDDEEIWVYSDDFEQPLKYNNGVPYTFKNSDITDLGVENER